jgi:hypothetical protein
MDDGLVQLNDLNDPDTGPNSLMNYPVVNSATWNGATLTVNITLNSVPNDFYNLFIFVNRECDPSGYGEGELFLASHGLVLNATGTANFVKNISVTGIEEMEFVTTSASDPESTSEFSLCEEIVPTGNGTASPSPTLPGETPSPSPTPGETATPTATPTPTPGVSPTPSESGGATNSPTASPQGQELVWADVDCTDGVSPVDSLKILRVDAGLGVVQPAECPEIGEEVEVDGTPRLWGDIDCSSTLSPVDSLKVLRHDAGLSVEQGAGCPEMGTAVLVSQ